MTKEWYTAAELAEMNLPAMPSNRTAMIRRATSEGWKSRPRKGRGGGVEYHLSSLPATVQAKLIVRSTAVEKADKPERRTDDAARAARWAHYDSLPDNRKAKAKEKLAVLHEVETLRLGGMPVDIAAQQIAALRGVGLSTIHLWRSKVTGVPKADWLPYLADHYTGRTVTVECAPDAWEMIKSDYLRLEQPRFAGRTFGVDGGRGGRFNLNTIGPRLEELHERLAGVVVENLDFEMFLTRYDRASTLFYLDPPYWGTEGFYGKALFTRADFERLATALRGLQGRFILSINDRPEVRQTFSGFAMTEVATTYTVRGKGASTPAAELIISTP